jgi:hypothetical protein
VVLDAWKVRVSLSLCLSRSGGDYCSSVIRQLADEVENLGLGIEFLVLDPPEARHTSSNDKRKKHIQELLVDFWA